MPNADELTELTGAGSTLDEVVAASRSLVEGGVAAVYATRGADGLVVTTNAGSWVVASPVDVPGNPTGAGDAAAAAVAHGLATGRPHHEIAELALAVSAAAVAEPVAGRLDVEVQRLVHDGVITRPWVDARAWRLPMTIARMKELAAAARAAGVGIGAFNVIQLEHAEAIVTGAERAGRPVILQVSENTVDYHGSLAPLASAVLAIAEESAADVVVHLDHATRPELVARGHRSGTGFGHVRRLRT